MSARAMSLVGCLLGGLLAACDGGVAEPTPDRAVDVGPPADAAPDRGPPDMAPPPRDMAPPPPDMAPPRDMAPPAPDMAPPTPDMGPPPRACGSVYAPPEVVGRLMGDTLAEVSGIAFSASRPDVLWMHTDSGGEPVLYAVDTAGNARGEVRLPVDNEDWEDLAAADCPDGSGPCLWVADVGDNRRSRDDAAVYAVPEPVVAGGEAQRVWTFPVGYPGGPVDVEALAVAPAGDRFWLFEKVDAPVARVFGHPGPLVDGEAVELEEVTRINAPGLAIENGRSITAADLHPDGTRLVLRVYTGSYEYVFAEGAGPARGIADLPFVQPRTVSIGPLSEPQGEAITYDPSGRDVWTVSEDPELRGGQPLHRYRCSD